MNKILKYITFIKNIFGISIVFCIIYLLKKLKPKPKKPKPKKPKPKPKESEWGWYVDL